MSGAEQLKAIGAIAGLRPISSQSAAYSQLRRPGPKRSSGMKRFQRPSSRALLADLDQDLRVGDAGLHLVVERPQRLRLGRVDVLVHEGADPVAELDSSAG